MSTFAITVIIIGSVFAYTVAAGVVWHAVTRRWDDEFFETMGTLLWPVIPFAVAAMWLARVLAVRIPKWIVERASRAKLPRAKAAKRRSK